MGIKYLTSFVRKVNRSIATEHVREAAGPDGDPPQAFVIDAWAFIFAHFYRYDGDIAKGDFASWAQHCVRFIELLRRCKLEPVFVFDGPWPALKLGTILARREQQCRANSLFMRSSGASRATPSFQREVGLLPSIIEHVTRAALRQAGAEVIYAEAEADGLVAETAERRGGFAVSNDSDMYVLCSRGEGCGYVPLSTIEFLVKPLDSDQQQPGPAEGDGFEAVGKRRKGGRTAGSGAAEVYRLDLLAEPDAEKQVQLHAIRFEAHSAAKLAGVLGIPTTFLPLLATFNGNDYSSPVFSQLLSLRLPEGPERITAIAALIRQEWQNLAKRGPGGSPQSGSGANSPAVAEAKGARTPVRRVGLGRFAGPAFSSMSNTHEVNSDDGRSAPSSGTATPLAAANRRLGYNKAPSIASMQTLAPQSGVNAVEVSTALALDPVRDLVVRVLEQIISPGKRFQGRTGAPSPVLERLEASGEREALISGLLDGLAEYSLLSAPHIGSDTAEFFRHRAPQAPSRRRNASWWEAKPNPAVVTAWQSAYKEGHFSTDLVTTLTRRTYVTDAALEDPDAPSLQATALKKLRRWLWAILFSGGAWGMDWARMTMEEPEEEAHDGDLDDDPDAPQYADRKIKWIGTDPLAPDESPEDLIVVQTPSTFGDDDGPLARRLREEDEEEDEEEDAARSRPGSADGLEAEDSGVKPPPAVTEYVRRGERLKGEVTEIRHLAELLAENKLVLSASLLDLLGQYEAHDAAMEEASSASASTPGSQPGSPRAASIDLHQSLSAALEAASDPLPEPVPLLRLETRIELVLASLGVKAAAVRSLPLPLQLAAATIRYLVSEEADRLGDSSKRYNWSPREVDAAVFACAWSARRLLDAGDKAELGRASETLRQAESEMLPTVRSTHLCFAMQAALATVEQLLQALLLVQSVSLTPTMSFEGSLFHAHLLYADLSRLRPTKVEQDMRSLVTQGLEDRLAVDVATARAERKNKRRESRQSSGTSSPVPARANMFDVLLD